MDYEKAYKAALETATKWIKDGCIDKEKICLECVFPELRESEDERVIKRLSSLVRILNNEFFKGDNPSKEQCLAYLEKQKEPLHIEKTCKENADSFTDEDERIRKWLIDYFKAAGKSWIHRGFTCEQILAWLEKQKEQKPAECLKAERDGWYVCIKDFYGGGKKQCAAGELVQAKGGMYMMCREDISPWFRKAYYEEVRDALGSNTNTNIPERKPAEWSEEDWKLLDEMRAYLISVTRKIDLSPNNVYEGFIDLIDRLKSLHFQKPAEWSEEDELNCNRIIRFLEPHKTFYPTRETKEEMQNWLKNRLKSLRPSWKPSEEQMEALSEAVSTFEGYEESDAIKSLYNDLKKLGVKEEPEYYQHFDSDY